MDNCKFCKNTYSDCMHYKSNFEMCYEGNGEVYLAYMSAEDRCSMRIIFSYCPFCGDKLEVGEVKHE